MKRISALSISLIAFLCSCGPRLDSAFKAYMDGFSLDEGMELFQSATITYEESSYDSHNNLLSKTFSTTNFAIYHENNTEKYFLRTEITYEGEAIKDNIVSSLNDVRYNEEDGNYLAKRYQNEELLDEEAFTPNDVYSDILMMYYTDDTAGYYTGGLFYGDTILTRINSADVSKMQYKIDENNNLIIRSSSIGYEETSSSQDITVNSLGFLVELYWQMTALDNGNHGVLHQRVTYNTFETLPQLPLN